MVSEAAGFPGNTRVAVRLARNYWGATTSLSVGIIGDSNSGSLYQELTRYTRTYLATPCKSHCISPRLTSDKRRQTLTLTFRNRRNITLWTFDIPYSLDTQVSSILKSNYAPLRRYANEDEIIRAAGNLLQISQEDVIRKSVGLLATANQRWFNDLCNKLRRDLLS
jgi:hypothetical protein